MKYADPVNLETREEFALVQVALKVAGHFIQTCAVATAQLGLDRGRAQEICASVLLGAATQFALRVEGLEAPDGQALFSSMAAEAFVTERDRALGFKLDEMPVGGRS